MGHVCFETDLDDSDEVRRKLLLSLLTLWAEEKEWSLHRAMRQVRMNCEWFLRAAVNNTGDYTFPP
ncbi:hypothetical protein [Chitinivibrio alkaliphilus]|uniref:Uncharacterized protein n=1 Tax=Chitinivibrio alkaliphilus ACht1 TaxID=1313304 RepID=U7D6R4_9BACT|nr:hypothetical protein [Chitinivibrio alkaliphilus]ERP31261.1 hypothetical protein CALK_1880 [Chitinivibrio alkaliphilus ACht1]